MPRETWDLSGPQNAAPVLCPESVLLQSEPGRKKRKEEPSPEAQGNEESGEGGDCGGGGGPGGLRAELQCCSRLCPPREESQEGPGVFCQARLAFQLPSLLLKKQGRLMLDNRDTFHPG